MKLRLLSSLAKFTISAISIVAVSACVMTLCVKCAESRLSDISEYTYKAQPVGNKYSSLLEGGYWQLTAIEDTVSCETIKVTMHNINSVLDLLSDKDASYAYSYKNGTLASFWPMADAKTVLQGWDLAWYENYLVLEAVIPGLKEDNQNMSSGEFSTSYAEFCAVFGSTLPCIAMTSLKDYAYQEDLYFYQSELERYPAISYGLHITSLTNDDMELSKGSHKFRYERVKSLPMQIAPISVYFQETAYARR